MVEVDISPHFGAELKVGIPSPAIIEMEAKKYGYRTVSSPSIAG